jgi:xanthosine utilization system XapX-like protein
LCFVIRLENIAGLLSGIMSLIKIPSPETNKVSNRLLGTLVGTGTHRSIFLTLGLQSPS